MGHHVEFLEHAARYSAAQSDIQIHLVVHPHIEEHAPSLVQLASAHPNCVFLHPLTESEFEATERTDTIFSRALAGWEAAEKRGRQVGADHCVFMEMNAYQPILGLPRVRQAPFQTSGILFFPYCRLDVDSSSWKASLHLQAEKVRKHLQLRWVLSNPNVHTLFLLNDPWAARELSSALGSDALASLPDPVPLLPDAVDVSPEVSTWMNAEWGADRTHFLLFGSLREAKGVRPALKAFHQLNDADARTASLHILGRTRAEMAESLPKLVDALRIQQPKLHVHFEDRYLSESELSAALHHSDVILAPYLRTEGSSGVLGHAARYKRPVIGPSTGLIGQLIETYGLGTGLPEITATTLSCALRSHLQKPDSAASKQGMQQYVKERSPEVFARTFFQTIRDGAGAPPVRN